MGRLLRCKVLRVDASHPVSSARYDAAGRESLVVWTNETVNVPAEERRLSRYSESA